DRLAGDEILQPLVARAEAGRFVLGDLPSQSAVDQQAAESDHKRLQADFGDQQAVRQADGGGDEQGERHGDGDEHAPFQKDGQQTADQGDHRADRQVDAASDDDEGHADADDAVQRAPAQQVRDVEGGQELRIADD